MIIITSPTNTIAKYYFDHIEEHRAGSLVIWVCQQIKIWQNEIEAYIDTQHNGNTSLFSAGESVRSSAYITSVVGTTPAISTTDSENNCPTIEIQLNSNHILNNRYIHRLNNIKFKSKATCVNNTITKWTIYTNTDSMTLNTTIHNFDSCPGNIVQDQNLSL